ncbi:uncharacterized protein LOC127102962 [Lathyrus oleraceus]|uniref:uncharacterized protein LOC127102962 n=1 Tax=Pisum sativum TaxID=3888 RepID=UPI0021CEF958|nr:uncharacterized protein LOC127102962 [Pisum sativum]
MGMRLEEGVREGRLSKDEVYSRKKYGGSVSKKKEGETNTVSVGWQRRPHVRENVRPGQQHHQVSSVILVFTNNLANQSVPVQQQQQQPQQRTNSNNNNHHHNFERNKVSFDPIPMMYAELYPSLVIKNLIQPRNPPQTPEPLPWWFKPILNYAFHQGAPGRDIANCYPLKVFDVRRIQRSLVEIHRDMCLFSDYEHDHDVCVICSVNPRGCVILKRDTQKLMDENVIQIQQSRYMGNDVNVIVPVFKTPGRVVIQYESSKKDNRSVLPLVIRLEVPVPYSSDKDVPYKYNATMIENGQEAPVPVANSVVSIVNVVKVTRSGRVFGPVSPKVVEDVSMGTKAEVPAVDPISAPTCQSGESKGFKANDGDELLRLIMRSEFNIVDQLLQTLSNIFMLSLLMNSEAQREALQKV